MSRKVYTRLAITDRAEHSWKMTMPHRKSDDETYVLDIDSGEIGELKYELIKLLKSGVIFQNAVFTTHGNSGMIFFADRYIDANELYHGFYHDGLERLFPFKNAKVYFGGCNVAEGDDGWGFLKAAALTFLRYAGGSAIGWTSAGFSAPTWVPWVGGHQGHAWGDTRRVSITPSAGGGADLHFYESGVVSNTKGTWPPFLPGENEVEAP